MTALLPPPPGVDAAKIVVLVDLTPLRSGGSNGGIKSAALTLLRGLSESAHPFSFVYLTSASSHAEVRSQARDEDLVVCVREDKPWAEVRDPDCFREYLLSQPPPDLPRHFGVDLCYSPFGALFYFSPDVPSISLICDLLHEDWPYGLRSAEKEERKKYIQFSCAQSSLIQCISRTGAESLRKRYNISPEKIFYTYLPPPLPPRTPETKTGRRPFFFYPANFWPHKNHELLLIAYNIYRNRRGKDAWDLVLTGHPDRKMDQLRELADLMGADRQVFFEGYVSSDEMENLYQSAGALVFPSLHEGFGIPVLEAWQYGKPVICSNVFSLPEVGGDSCRYVDPRNPQSIADALEAVSANPDLANELALKGRERLNLFDLKIEVEHLARKMLSFGRPVWKKNDETRKLLLELHTPVDQKLWTFVFKSGAIPKRVKFSLYLEDWPFGSHSFLEEKEVRLQLRPGGRRLRIFVGESEIPDQGDLFSEIQASSSDGIRLQLYQVPA